MCYSDNNSTSRYLYSSLTEGKFPYNLKVAKVKPIFKKGEKHSIENYRLLSGFSKILEKVMYNRVIPFLESNKTLSTSQFVIVLSILILHYNMYYFAL